MIRINLLPPELQRAAGTPKALFLTLIGGIVATMLLGVAVLWLWFSVRSLEDDKNRRQVDVNIAKENAQEVDRINEDIRFYKERETAILEIKERRVLLAPKLDQLIERTPEGILITEMAMETLDRADYKWEANKLQTGGRLTLTCFAEGAELTALTEYRKALTGERAFYKNLVDISALPDNFFSDFVAIADPSWSRVNLEAPYQGDFLRFVLELQLKARYEKPVAKEEPKPVKKKKSKK
ncbi:MAG: PilN domain-containing protein [Planctomycetota bacterium]